MEARQVAYLMPTFKPYLPYFRFNNAGAIIFGPGVAKDIGKNIKEIFGVNKVLVITDKNLIKIGILKRVEESLRTAGVDMGVFSDVKENPTVEICDAAGELLKKDNYKLVIGIGGGSCIDGAKGASIVASNGGSIRDYEGMDKVKKPIIPLIAVPTTAGSGSEVTSAAVITDKKRNWKMGLRSLYIIPSLAVCDPELTLTLPPRLTASTGMDALTHAIESYTSTIKQPISEVFALEAIRLIGISLRKSVMSGDQDIEARSNMLLGSILAGMAFPHTYLGIGHAMARALGGIFNIAHGLANATVLSHIMEFNAVACPEKYRKIAQVMGENEVKDLTILESAYKAVEVVHKLTKDIGIPTLSQLGIKEEDIDLLADEAMKSGDRNFNPRITKKEDFIKLFYKAL